MSRIQQLLLICAAVLGVSLGAFFASDGGIATTESPVKSEAVSSALPISDPPEDVLARLMGAVQIENALERSAIIFDAVNMMGSAEISALMERVKLLPFDVRTPLEVALFRRWLFVDRDAAGRWMAPKALDLLIRRDRPYFRGRDVVGEWVRIAPEAALAFAVAHPSAKHSAQFASSAANSLARDNANEAVRILAAMQPGHVRDEALAVVLRGSAKNDPAGMFALLSHIGDAEKRGWTALSILKDWAQKDGVVPIAAVNSLLPQVPENLATRLASDVAANAGKSAASWALTLNGPVREHATAAVYSKWLESDPLSALRWIEREGLHGNPLTAGLRNSVGKFHPAAMRDQLLKIPDSPVRTGFILSTIWSFPDADAFRLISTLPESEQDTAASYLALTRRKEKSPPDEALSAWISAFPEGPARAGAAARTGRELASRDFPDLMGSQISEKDKPASEKAFARLQSTLAQLPDTATRDAFAASASRQIASSDEAKAETLARTITDPTRRNLSLAWVYLSFQEKSAANAFLERSGIPAEWHAELRQRRGD